jgi:uncharacterized membrane protein YhaH (DUF805 family)
MTRSAGLAGAWLLSQALLSARGRPEDEAANAAAGVLGCLGCGTFLLIPVVVFVAQIAVLIWVARDSKARGMDGAVVWMIFVFLVPVIGLIVYIFSRPQGALVKCASCGNMRLQAAARCPHCGNA